MVQRANIVAYTNGCENYDAIAISIKSQRLKNWVQQFEACINEKRIIKIKLKLELLNVAEWDREPEDAIQKELLPDLPPSGGYENIVTARDVFSRDAFEYPVSTFSAVSAAKVILKNMTRHAYITTQMITDEGSVSPRH